MTLAEKTLANAKLTVGVKETSANWSKYIKIYLNFVGLFSPQPWCAAYLVFQVHKAAGQLGIKARIPKTGGCQVIYNWAEKNGYVSTTPTKNSIFLQWHEELNRYAHTGFVQDVKGTKFRTIEGNSNSDGSREGYEVAENWRTYVPGKYVFVRIV